MKRKAKELQIKKVYTELLGTTFLTVKIFIDGYFFIVYTSQIAKRDTTGEQELIKKALAKGRQREKERGLLLIASILGEELAKYNPSPYRLYS